MDIKTIGLNLAGFLMGTPEGLLLLGAGLKAALSFAYRRFHVERRDAAIDASAIVAWAKSLGEQAGWIGGLDVAMPTPNQAAEIGQAASSDNGLKADTVANAVTTAAAKVSAAGGTLEDFEKEVYRQVRGKREEVAANTIGKLVDRVLR